MNQDTSQNMVKIAMVVIPIVVGINFFRNKDRAAGEGFRTAWAIGALMLILAMLSDALPSIAGPLALLITMGVLFFEKNTIGGIIHITGGGA